MAPHLWVMSTQSSQNISPLHDQRVKGRRIVVTEDPRLHLVWLYDRVFVKPIPKYLLSHQFWTTYLCRHDSPLGKDRQEIFKAALGYLRTYQHLIKHESDFNIAQEDGLRLLPQHLQYDAFCRLASAFDLISDSEVSARYSYGELRLTRLNLYGRLFLRRSSFEYIHGQYADIFSRYYGPFLFMFGALSVILSAMQVELAVEQRTTVPWNAIWPICRWFSVLSLVGTLVMAATLFGFLLWLIADEWIFALRARRRRQRTRAICKSEQESGL